MLSCVVEALDFPDVACVSRWFLGHAVVGDIPDTGLFRPCLTEFAADPSEILSPASNRLWNAKLVSSIEHQAASASPEQLDILRGVERQTRKELSQKGTHGPFTAAQLHKRFGKDVWRVARRFGVAQGVQEDGSAKIRAIDNERGNSGNDATRTHETIAPISVSFVAITARVFLQCCSLLGTMMVALSFGLDDIKAARSEEHTSELQSR